MAGRDDYRSLSGPQKAGLFMLAIGMEHSTKLFEMMGDEEIRELSQHMSSLGTINASIVERIFVEFADQLRARRRRREADGDAARRRRVCRTQDGRQQVALVGCAEPGQCLTQAEEPHGEDQGQAEQDGWWDAHRPTARILGIAAPVSRSRFGMLANLSSRAAQ